MKPVLYLIAGIAALAVIGAALLLWPTPSTPPAKAEPLARHWSTARLERELAPRATVWRPGTNLVVPQGITCRQFNFRALARVVLVCS